MSKHYRNHFVLVVEDDANLNRLLCKKLKSKGLKAEGVFSVRHAIAYLNTYMRPALIVLDLNLEDGNGTEVLQQLVELGIADTSVIVMSAALEEYKEDLGAYEVTCALQKPFSPAEVAELAVAEFVNS